MKTSFIVKRLKAFVIDYCIILLYIGLLVVATLYISNIFHLQLDNVDPVTAELIGFTTLTLPVILYFTLSENGKYGATIGKRKFGLHIVSNDETRAGMKQLLARNCIKFLPWELAHFFIYRVFYFTTMKQEAPVFVLTGLIVAQVLAIIYLLFIFFHKKSRSVYELFSRTMVVQRSV